MNALKLGILCLLTSCVTAPEFDRNNPRDRFGDVPGFQSLNFQIFGEDIRYSWIDVSRVNEVYVLTIIKYDMTVQPIDSVIETFRLDGEEMWINETSRTYGVPHRAVLTSFLEEGNNEGTYADTLDVIFGELTLIDIFQSQSTGRILFRWSGETRHTDLTLIQVLRNETWETLAEVTPQSRAYELPGTGFNSEETFRIALTKQNFNGSNSIVDSLTKTITIQN